MFCGLPFCFVLLCFGLQPKCLCLQRQRQKITLWQWNRAKRVATAKQTKQKGRPKGGAEDNPSVCVCVSACAGVCVCGCACACVCVCFFLCLCLCLCVCLCLCLCLCLWSTPKQQITNHRETEKRDQTASNEANESKPYRNRAKERKTNCDNETEPKGQPQQSKTKQKGSPRGELKAAQGGSPRRAPRRRWLQFS